MTPRYTRPRGRSIVPAFVLGLALHASMAGASLTPLWTRLEASPGDDQASALTVDAAGYVYVTGTSGLIPDLDYMTIKYAPGGAPVWTRHYDGSTHNLDFSYAVAVDAGGNVFVTGGSMLVYPNYDYLTVKYAPNGDTLWTRRHHGSSDEDDFAFAIAVDGAGNAYVTGQTDGINGDITTIKYTPTGDAAWIRTYDGPANGDDRGNVVVVDASGNPYVAGWSTGPSGLWDYIVIKYDPAGNVLWSKTYDGGAADQAFGLALDTSGNAFIAGRSMGAGTGFDYALVKYDVSGTQQWVRRYNGTGNSRDDGFGCAVDAGGNCYVTGFSVGVGSAEDAVTVKYAPNGDSLWVRGHNGAANLDDYAYYVAVAPSGLVYVGALDNGGPTSYDIETLVYMPDGRLVSADPIDGTAHGFDQPGNGYYPTPYLAVDDAGNVYLTGFVSDLNTGTDAVTVKYGPATVGVADEPRPPGPRRLPALTRIEPHPMVDRGIAEVDVGVPTRVSLELFDLRGSRRETLWSERLVAPGHYRVPLAVSGLGQGVYFLRLSANGASRTAPVVVLH